MGFMDRSQKKKNKESKTKKKFKIYYQDCQKDLFMLPKFNFK